MRFVKKIFAAAAEYIFFIAVMFLLFYMVACVARVYFGEDADVVARPVESEFLVYSAEGSQTTATLPASFNVPNTTMMTAVGTLPEDLGPEDEFLGYYVSFQTVKVYVDGELRSVADGTDSYFRTDVPANHIDFAPLTPADAGKELKLTYESPLYNYKGVLGRLSIGTKLTIARGLFRHRLPVIFLGMFVFFFGMILLGVGISNEAQVHINRIYRLLGFAAIFMGAWFILQSCMCQIFFSDITWVHWMELMCLVFLPVPLLFFMDECTHGLYWNLIQPICIATMAFEIMSLVLTLGGYDAMRFIVLIHGFLAISILFALWILTDIFRTRKELFKDLYWVVAGFIIFFITALVEGVQFYAFPRSEEGAVLAVGVAVFFVCCYIWLQKQRVYYTTQEASQKQKARTKNLFLTNMSHEIRTPVNTILIANAMIEKESQDPEIRTLAHDSNMEGKKLLALINDILDYSRITTHHMKLENSNYDMVWFLRDLYRLGEKFHEDAPQIDFAFKCNPQLPSYLNGDEAKIRRIMENIIRKGFADCRYGSSIRLYVDFRSSNPEEGMLLISVACDGKRITKESSLAVLDAFSDKSYPDAFDVDVNLVDGMLRLMDGELEFLSDEDVETQITIRIPQRIVEIKPIGEANAKSVERAIILNREITKHLLVVDDEEMNHRILKEMLRGENIVITDAYSGEEALELAKKNHYDVVFIDNQMMGLNGVETAVRMKADEMAKNFHTPVIMMTAASMTKEELRFNGFSGFVSKPMERQAVLRVLKTLEEGGWSDVETI